MRTSVVGIIPPDEHWRKMKAIWDSCKEADIEPPEKVRLFFDPKEHGDAPDEAGVVVNIPSEEWDDGDMQIGVEVDVSKIPEHVKRLRFVNSC